MKTLLYLLIPIFGLVSCIAEENDPLCACKNVESNQLKAVTLLLPSNQGQYIVDTNKVKNLEFTWQENYISTGIEDKVYIFRMWQKGNHKPIAELTDTVEKLFLRKDVSEVIKKLPKPLSDTVKLKWNISSLYTELKTVNQSTIYDLVLLIK